MTASANSFVSSSSFPNSFSTKLDDSTFLIWHQQVWANHQIVSISMICCKSTYSPKISHWRWLCSWYWESSLWNWEQQHQTTRSNSSRIAPINTFTVDSCSLFGPRSLMKFVWEFMIIFISKHKLCRDNYALWNLVEKTMWVSTPDQVFVWCSHYYNKVF